jgi:hypothetical protein
VNIYASSIESSLSFITVSNPFDGVEVGSVVTIPPENAELLIRQARKAHTHAVRFIVTNVLAYWRLVHRWSSVTGMLSPV